ncbi:MAG TPA: OsmC family protein [Candidatus Cloacimonadota bacterium]|nr:OsmC family protein [Candidatus Cloacimonadota bacterium]
MFHVHVDLKDNRKVDASIREFTIRTDQPFADGGDNSAPSPFEYFLASLATCAGIYVKGFCMKRNIDTDDIKLDLTTEYGFDGKMNKIKIAISVPQGFPEQYLHSLISVSELCAVKKVIQSPPEFEITTAYK